MSSMDAKATADIVDKMDLVFLGTMSGAPPAGYRNHTCTALRMDNVTWLFDCGDCAQGQLQKSTLSAANITRVFITHMHGDHCFGLPGMLCNIATGVLARGQKEPVVLVGPQGLRDYVRVTLGSTFCRLGEFKYVVHELAQVPMPAGIPPAYEARPDAVHVNEEAGLLIAPDSDGCWTVPAIASDRGVRVRACYLPHTIATVGFSVTEPARPGKLDASKVRPVLQRFGLPLSLMSKLKAGESVALPDGSTLDPAHVLAAPPPPRRLIILGDTSDGTAARALGAGCSVLVHEATNACTATERAAGQTPQMVEELAISHGHSTPEMAGRVAAALGAQCLAMTHFSPRYRGDGSAASLAVMAEIADLARSAFAGTVLAMRDFDALAIPASGAVPTIVASVLSPTAFAPQA
jgi:ribonuclease Z